MKLELSTWTIIKTLLILLSVFLLWQIRDVLVLLFVVLIIVSALGPSVRALQEVGIPRLPAALLLLVLILSGFGLLIALVVPALVHQLQQFISVQLTTQVPDFINRFGPLYESFTQGQQLLGDIVKQLQNVSGNVFAGIVSIFGGVLTAFTVIILSFYLLVEEKHTFKDALLNLLPTGGHNQISQSLTRITEKLGAWLRGQFLLCLIIGITTGVAMSLIGVTAPLAIGVLAGVLEIVPIIGPLITGLLILLFALITPGVTVLLVILSVVYFVLLQFLEGHILVPKIMEKAIGLSPVLVILALLIGSKLGGITGAVLALPIAAIIQVIIEDYAKPGLKKTNK